jgi:uncharacterized protein (TIGR02569 family)
VTVPEHVLASFGVTKASSHRLPSGRGITWRAGQIVLKPAGPPEPARWTAGLFDQLDGPDFRVPRPVRSASGDWIADGWVAWRWLPGEHADWSGVSPRWPGLVAVSRAFHAALEGQPRPEWIGLDGSRWTAGDLVAWGERDLRAVLSEAEVQPQPRAGAGTLGAQIRDQVSRLLDARRPVQLPAQLIHGDLGGNVLFSKNEPPAVIDFAPYWRPAGLALAIAAVDALTWQRADPEILANLEAEMAEMAKTGEIAEKAELNQLLARAHVYRLVTEVLARPDGSGLDEVNRTAQPVTDLILDRIKAASGARRRTHATDTRPVSPPRSSG